MKTLITTIFAIVAVLGLTVFGIYAYHGCLEEEKKIGSDTCC